MTTAFFSDERCFWHAGGNYAFTLPVGDLVQPIPGGLPENPETKRRLRNLIEVGLDLPGAADACGAAQRRLLGLEPVRIVPGEAAELVVLDDALAPLRTIVDGRWFEPS